MGNWEGVLNYYKANEAYLQGQLGNPKGEDQPNKKYYDPRVWLRAGQTSMIARLEKHSRTERDRRSVSHSLLLISRPALRVFFAKSKVIQMRNL